MDVFVYVIGSYWFDNAINDYVKPVLHQNFNIIPSKFFSVGHKSLFNVSLAIISFDIPIIFVIETDFIFELWENAISNNEKCFKVKIASSTCSQTLCQNMHCDAQI